MTTAKLAEKELFHSSTFPPTKEGFESWKKNEKKMKKKFDKAKKSGKVTASDESERLSKTGG